MSGTRALSFFWPKIPRGSGGGAPGLAPEARR